MNARPDRMLPKIKDRIVFHLWNHDDLSVFPHQIGFLKFLKAVEKLFWNHEALCSYFHRHSITIAIQFNSLFRRREYIIPLCEKQNLKLAPPRPLRFATAQLTCVCTADRRSLMAIKLISLSSFAQQIRLNFLQMFTLGLLRVIQIPAQLQIHPEICGNSEEFCQAQR